jgi:hypothetical protein
LWQAGACGRRAWPRSRGGRSLPVIASSSRRRSVAPRPRRRSRCGPFPQPAPVHERMDRKRKGGQPCMALVCMLLLRVLFMCVSSRVSWPVGFPFLSFPFLSFPVAGPCQRRLCTPCKANGQKPANAGPRGRARSTREEERRRGSSGVCSFERPVCLARCDVRLSLSAGTPPPHPPCTQQAPMRETNFQHRHSRCNDHRTLLHDPQERRRCSSVNRQVHSACSPRATQRRLGSLRPNQTPRQPAPPKPLCPIMNLRCLHAICSPSIAAAVAA